MIVKCGEFHTTYGELHSFIVPIFWFGLSFMKFLIRSLTSPLVYWINCVNLTLGSSIFFSSFQSVFLNIDIKCVYSRLFPSNGSKSTCGAECSFTNLHSISMLFFGPTTGSFCILLSSYQWLSSLNYIFYAQEDWLTPPSSPLLQLGYNFLIFLLESASDITAK